MKLLRITLQGFKSFADKTTIDFSEGMTVIVGPNGCGKSNISDAVRWVLGEQNIRNLRGQKAEDIIFSGSESRSAKNGAEVTLVLDNSAHELPLDTAEVSVSRRILRNGDSDFQINKRNCRLKDIQELLAPTGLGKGSLAIIGQNRVDQVLTAHPEERRLIFEEVAGISLYRMRKNEGLRKLEKTAENMERVKDMTALLDEQLIPLKEGAEKAKKYKALCREKTALEATMSLLKLTSIRRMMARYENEYIELKDQDAAWQTKLSQCSLAKESLEKERLEKQEALRLSGDAMAKAQQQMEKLRGDFRVKEEALHHAAEKAEELAVQEEDQQGAEQELAEEMQVALEEAQAALKEKALWQARRDHAEEEKKSLALAVQASEEHYAKAMALSRQKLAEKEKLEQDISYEIEACSRLEKEQAQQAAAAEAQEAALDSLRKDIAQKQADMERKAQEMAACETEGKRDSQALKAAKEARFRLMNELSRLEAAQAALRSKREYLEHGEKEYANFSRTTKTLMEQRERFGDAIHGVLGELIRVPDAYTEAAEVALGGQISYIVTDTTAQAGQMIRWLKEKKLGRTTFYPLEAMKPRYSNALEKEAAGEAGICGIAAELFSCAPLYRDLLDSLLGKTLIAENLEVARRVAKKYNYRLRLVTKDGQVVHAGGSMTGGSMRKAENTFFGRKKEITALMRQETEIRQKEEQCKQDRQQQEARCDRLSDRVTKEREAWQALQISMAEDKAHLEGLKKTLAEKEQQAAEMTQRQQEAEVRLQQAAQSLTAHRRTLETYVDLPAPEEDHESHQLREKLEQKSKEILDIHVSLTKAEEAVSFGEKMKQERQQALAAQRADREALDRAKKENEKVQEILRQEREQVKLAFAAAEKEWQAIRQKQGRLQELSDGFAIKQKEVDSHWRKAQEKSSAVRAAMAEREGRIENFKTREAEELQHLEEQKLTLAEAEALRLPGAMADMKAKEETLAVTMASLGTVNPNGEEDYARQLERRRFYEEQINDLTRARDGLETIIHDIDATMEKQFREAFEKINKEFGRIMQMMFLGGHAKLELTDTGHPLEGGVEMYLQLPGKKRQPLTLMSGGERALTVIALLISFMAYRPAPFCFVDEIDAALDDANVERYSRMVADYKGKTQFIVISHRKKTMEYADTLQGVTMAEKGVSSLITVKMKDYVEK